MQNQTPNPDSNMEKVGRWKARLAALGFQNSALASAMERDLVTISRWFSPDKYGLPPAGMIDRVEAWFEWHESRARNKKK